MSNPALTLSPPLAELLVAQVHDHALILMDANGLVVDWLGGAEDILGYSAEEMRGRTVSAIFTSEDRARGLDSYELLVAAAESRSDDDRWHLRKDGTLIWVTGSVVALRDAAGDVVGFAKVLRDRTDLRTQLDHLARRVSAQQAELDRNRGYLDALGHELRNPLAALGNAVELISRLTTDPAVNRALQIVRRQQDVLRRFSDDLTDLARVATGKLRLVRARIDLRALLADAATVMAPSAQQKGLRLQPLLPELPIWVQADPARLQQVVLNLLENAVKYTQAGGSVWIKLTEEGADAVFRIEDTGIGIAPDMLPRIFDLFTQDRSAAESAPGGLGIGLAVVRDLVELHDGEVLVRSSGLGKGAEFTVRIPREVPASD